MTDDISPADAARHDEIFDEGVSLVEGEVLLDGSGPSGRPGMFARRKLQKAIERFQGALEINPKGWQSMWMLGKIHQRLESQAESLFWFKKAMALAPDEPDVARETGLAAFEAGNTELALQCCQAALDARLDDPGLMANLALAYLLGGDLAEAEGFVSKALELVPHDPVSEHLSQIIREVAEGTRPQPASVDDIT